MGSRKAPLPGGGTWSEVGWLPHSAASILSHLPSLYRWDSSCINPLRLNERLLRVAVPREKCIFKSLEPRLILKKEPAKYHQREPGTRQSPRLGARLRAIASPLLDFSRFTKRLRETSENEKLKEEKKDTCIIAMFCSCSYVGFPGSPKSHQ